MNLNSKNVRLLIFDLGNTLVGFDHAIAARRLQEGTGHDFVPLMQSPQWKDLLMVYETGQMTDVDFHRVMMKGINNPLSYEEFTAIWTEIFFPLAGMEELLQKLHQHYPLYLMSNINALHFLYICDKFPFVQRLFKEHIVSYEVGHLKPEPQIFAEACRRSGLAPEQMLFIDDRVDLVQGALQFGLQALHYRGYDLLCDQLCALGVYEKHLFKKS